LFGYNLIISFDFFIIYSLYQKEVYIYFCQSFKQKILLSADINDPIASRTETEVFLRLFQKTNANITLKWQNSSHNLIQEDIVVARRWILNNFSVV
jgi:predicted esterase